MRSFLGPESVRADNALAAAQKQGKFEALREALFAHQPQERTGGFTTDQLLALGRSVGLAGQEFVNDVRSMTYAGWVAFVDDQASRDGNVGTPEVIKVGSGALRSEQLFYARGIQGRVGTGMMPNARENRRENGERRLPRAEAELTAAARPDVRARLAGRSRRARWRRRLAPP